MKEKDAASVSFLSMRTTKSTYMDKIKMADGQFADGTPQPLYFPEGHPQAGIFKGMAKILEERGYQNASKLHAQCGKSFQCVDQTADCCCRRILFNQPDFAHVDAVLEETCKARGFC